MAKKKKATPSKKAASKKETAAKKKTVAKKKTIPKKKTATPRNKEQKANKTESIRDGGMNLAHRDMGRPYCKTQQIYLGNCMSEPAARKIAEDHEEANPTHVVTVENC